jgi:methionyl-tRNA formyltransferase
MGRALARIGAWRLVCRPQPETGVTYAAKIDKAETRITGHVRRKPCWTMCAGFRHFGRLVRNLDGERT